MDANRVKSLATNVPVLKHRLNLNKLEVKLAYHSLTVTQTAAGGRFRNYIVFLTLAPILMMADFNGGLVRLGFVRTTF